MNPNFLWWIMLYFLLLLGIFIGGPALMIVAFFFLPKILNQQMEEGLKIRAKKRRESLEQINITQGWRYLTYFHLPLEELKVHFIYFLGVEKDMYLITNPMQGKFGERSAHIFDFQKFSYLDKGRTIKTTSKPITLLLINLSPQKVTRFWFSKTDWFDKWRLQRGTLPGIITQDFTIQGIDNAELRKIFTQQVIDHYQGRRDFGIEGSRSFLLLYAHTPAGTKETFTTLIREGEYALNHLLSTEISK